MSNKNLKIDKGILYFDRNRENFIKFDLEKNKNCEDIYNSKSKEIEQKIFEIYGKGYKDKNFNFILINSKINIKLDNSPLIELKLNPKERITDFLSNNLYHLCYLPANKNNIDIKKIKRNNLEEKKVKFMGIELESLYTHKIQNYLNNEGIYWFDKSCIEFVYCKGNIDEKKIEIITKKEIFKIPISTIRKEEYYENKIPSYIEGLRIKCPNYIFLIYYNNFSHIFGLYKQKSFLIWKNAINLARTKYNNINVDSTIDSDISTFNFQFFVRSQSILKKCYTFNQIMENLEKRQIFLNEFQDKKISDIILNILLYKININNKKYFEAWMNLKQISFHVDFNNIEEEKEKKIEIEKYSNIFTKERIDLYENAIKNANEAISQIKNLQNYEEEMSNALKNIFKTDLFDNLYNDIYELYLVSHFQKVKDILDKEYDFDEKPNIVKKYHLLLSKYCIKYFNMEKIDNFNCLCSNNSNRNNSDFNIAVVNTNNINKRNNSNIINSSLNFE